ncbi:MAG: PDZ domain-containing protein [Clostridia bacterium]|nr:PDZ domain-containing protein [Clostridia bacterium]
MYYNDYNRPQEPWEKTVENAVDPIHEEPEKPKKKKSGGAVKFVALGLVCALIGGFAGGGIAYMANGGGSTTITQGTRLPTVVNVAQVNNQTPLTAAQIYNKYVGSTVGITTEIVTTNYFGQPVSAAAAGSGFVISDDGYILTNYHVIDGATSIKVAFVDGATYDAKLVGGEEGNDIAVLKIEAAGLTSVVIGDSDALSVGEEVVAIGNPLGELTFSMSRGIVSAKDRNITMSDGTVMNYLQTDTAINSGNSGGPLFDMYGQVVGITSAKLSNNSSTSSEASIEGLGFAIPINDVKEMVQDIIKNGYVTGKPYMGITVKTIPASVAKEYSIAQGAQVQSVDSESCSAKAGLVVGDIITGIDQTTVTSSADLIAALKDYKSGQTAALSVNRNGAVLSMDVTFDEDTPQRREVQQKAQEEQTQQQQQQQQQQGGNNFFWPFGGGNSWFY